MTPITVEEMVQRAELDQVYMIPATRGSVHKAMLKIQKIAHELNYTLSTQQAQVILDDDLHVVVVFVVTEKPEQVEDDGWIQWKGGNRPVGPDQKVRVRFRDGYEIEGTAGKFYWGLAVNSYDNSYDIIAYKIIED